MTVPHYAVVWYLKAMAMGLIVKVKPNCVYYVRPVTMRSTSVFRVQTESTGKEAASMVVAHIKQKLERLSIGDAS